MAKERLRIDDYIKISSEGEFLELKATYDRNQRILQICSICGEPKKTVLKRVEFPCVCRGCKISQTNIEKYGNACPCNVGESKEKALRTMKDRYGVEHASQSVEIQEKAKETNRKLYGTDYAIQNESVKDKFRNTCKEKYGVDNPAKNADVIEKGLKSKEAVYGEDWGGVIAQKSAMSYHNHVESDSGFKATVNEKRKQTCIERYGHESILAVPEFLEKFKATSLQNYGVEHPMKSEQVLQKVNKTCMERYGVDSPLMSDEVKAKISKTNLERYGAENPFGSDIVKEKIKRYYKETYGVDYCGSVPEVIEKAKATKLEKYGTLHFNQMYVYDGLLFDSSWELAYWIYHKDNGFDIQREPISFTYEYNGASHIYYPDFSVNGELVEIKGDHFFNDDGSMRNPYDSSLDGLFEAKHQCGIQNGVRFLRGEDLGYVLDYVNNKYSKDYLFLFKAHLPFPYPNPDLRKKTDLGLIHHFHKSLYEATRKGKLSPLEAWQDKGLIKKSALNRLQYVGRCTPSDVLQGFNVAKIAPKVSLFKPALAEKLINTYLSEYDTIFDPFSGFSGRLLGAYNTGKKYIGRDIHKGHVSESNQIISYKGMGDGYSVVEMDLLSSPKETFECLFTCPPYGGKEHWNEKNDEIEKTCDEWIDECLSKFDCKAYLFVVDNTERYADFIVDTISNHSHFGTNYEKVVFITHR